MAALYSYIGIYQAENLSSRKIFLGIGKPTLALLATRVRGLSRSASYPAARSSAAQSAFAANA
jgi:hypothetical protein